MGAVVADTHTIIWYLLNSNHLSANATQALDEAIAASDPIYLASISIVEIVYLVEKSKLPNAALEQLNSVLAAPDSGVVVVPLDLAVVEAMKEIPRDVVPDMPDRIIAATARYLNLPLVTCDSKIQTSDIDTI